MQLECYKTLWGHNGGFALACQQAQAAGFTGVEGPAPESRSEQARWRQHAAQRSDQACLISAGYHED